MAQEKLTAYLRSLLARGGEAVLVLKSGSPPRLRSGESVEDLGSEVLDKVEVARIARIVVPPGAARVLMERRQVEFGFGVDGLGRFRTTAYSQRASLALVFRPVRLSPPALGDLGLPDGVRAAADEHRGLVMVAGPAGSGRTTTLHAMVDHVNHTRPSLVATVEEPVEVVHKDAVAVVNQVEVWLDADDAASGARSALRQGAEVLMVGGVHEAGAAEACLAGAEAGRLVLIGVDGREPGEVIAGFVRLFPGEDHDRVRLRLAGALAGLVVQHLVPLRDGAGRVAAAEVLLPTTKMREAVIEARTGDELREGALGGRRPGTQTLEESLAELCLSGTIDLRTAMTWAPRWHELRRRLERQGMDTARAT